MWKICHRLDPYLILLLALMAAAAYFCFQPSIRGNDGVQNVVYLQSLLFDRDLDFTNDYQQYYYGNPEWFDNHFPPSDPVTGRPINLYGVGNSVLWAPLFSLGYFAWWIIAPDALPASGTFVYRYAVGIQSLLYAAIGIILLYGFLKRRFGAMPAFWSAMTVWFASPLFFYAYAHGSMSHANSFFLSVLLLICYLNAASVVRWGVLGAVAGLLVLVRFQDAVLLLFPAIGELLLLYDKRKDLSSHLRKSVPRWSSCVIVGLCVLSLQCLAWNVLQGHPFSGPRAYMNQGSFAAIPIHAFQVLFSSFHGLFHWHPILILGLAGLIWPLKTDRNRERFLCLVTFLAVLWVVGSWSCWWAGASFGHRMFISAFPFLAYGIAVLLSHYQAEGCRLRVWTIQILILLGILWNAGLIWQYASRIPRDAPVSVLTVCRNYRAFF